MDRVVLYLLITALCIKYSSANCSEKIIQKIKKLKGRNAFSNIIERVAGSYRFDYIDVGMEFQLYPGGCTSGTISRITKKRVLITYDGLLEGTYLLQYNHKSVEHVDKHGIVYGRSYVVSAVNGVYALYTCFVTGKFSSIAAVIVPRNVKGRSLTAAVNASKKLLIKLGFRDGFAIPPCPLKT